MKSFSVVLLMIVASLPLYAQQEWRVKVASGQAYYVTLKELRGDTLVMFEGYQTLGLDLRDIVAIGRTLRSGVGSGALTGATIGAAVGLAFGLAATYAHQDSDKLIPIVGATLPLGGVIGGVIGAAIGSADHDEEIYLLAGMPLAEKGVVIQYLIGRPPVPPRP